MQRKINVRQDPHNRYRLYAKAANRPGKIRRKPRALFRRLGVGGMCVQIVPRARGKGAGIHYEGKD